jgi:hypothetical protein
VDGGWSYGGSILSFAFPMALFVVVAAWLYVTYTKPQLVPGRPNLVERPVIYTPVPGPPSAADRENEARTEGGA